MDGSDIGQLVGLLFLAGVTLWWLQRKKDGESCIRTKIKDEGGQVLGYSTIGFLFVDPFSHSTSDAAGHRLWVRYADREGIWYVRTSSKRPDGEWLWGDAEGRHELPVSRSDDSRVVARVRRIPSRVFAVATVVILVIFFAWGFFLSA